jgi:uncharacterized protein (DUF58 family)
MSRLGWHFIFVGTFAMMGGAIRGFNLPLVLSGLIVGALLMQWRLARRMIEVVESRRRLPNEAFVGQTFTVRFLVSNHSRWLPALLLRIDDQIDAPVIANEHSLSRSSSVLNRLPLAKSTQSFKSLTTLFRRESTQMIASCGVGRVNANSTVVAQYDCLATQRGRYDFGPSTFSTGMPLGLMVIRRASDDRQSLYVFPRILPLKRDWRRRLQSRSGGISTTARRSGANDGDFFGLRSWQAGDSRRWIHWRTTARIGEPAVRQFEQQKRFELCVLVDGFWPSQLGPAQLGSAQTGTSQTSGAAEAGADDDNLENVISAAASIVTAIVPTPTNRVALAVAGTTSSVVAGAGNREQLSAMLRLLADLTPSEKPDLSAAVDQVFRSVGKPQDLLIISPRSMPPEAEEIRTLVNGRCTLRWYSTEDGTIDLLVDRFTHSTVTQRQVPERDHTLKTQVAATN